VTRWVETRNTGRGEYSVEVPNTGDGTSASVTQNVVTREDWIDSRLRGVELVARQGPTFRLLARAMLTRTEARNVALVTVCHWALETGLGESERNYNGGSIHCPSDNEYDGACIRLGSGEELRAYDSAAEGITAYLLLLNESQYRQGWVDYLRGIIGGIQRVQRAGYSPSHVSTNAELRSILRRVWDRAHGMGWNDVNDPTQALDDDGSEGTSSRRAGRAGGVVVAAALGFLWLVMEE